MMPTKLDKLFKGRSYAKESSIRSDIPTDARDECQGTGTLNKKKERTPGKIGL